MITAIAAALEFLLKHIDLIEAIESAIESGASKESVLRAIRESQIAASDAAMHEALDP